MIAAVVKIMTNTELVTVTKRLFNPVPSSSNTNAVALGSPQHFGSRIQPNSPGDDEEEILFSILEGLSYGCGDVIIGINPASDDLQTIVRLEKLLRQVVERLALPTRYCVLSDIIKQDQARAHTRVDVGFQSLAGTSKALVGMVGMDVDGIADLAGGFAGLYFETGQGSEVTNGTAEGIDMVTLESRTYGVARSIRRNIEARNGNKPVWMIVNDVAGFIGPEVFRTPEQLLRACLEDIVMAKLHGLSMGLDICATFHMGIEPHVLQHLTQTIVEQAEPAYLMGVAGNADPMLGYLTTSFREHPRLRRSIGRQMTSAMSRRLSELGVLDVGGEPRTPTQSTATLYAAYCKEGGDRRDHQALRNEAFRKIESLQRVGFDLGYGAGADYSDPKEIDTRIQRIYRHARRALYAGLDDVLVNDVSPRHIKVCTHAMDREDYLAHPPSGESIRAADIRDLLAMYPSRRPQIQIVISDGLNANAINENLRPLLPPLRQALISLGYHVGDCDIVIENGRVRAGYHVGELLDVDVVTHLIGERPGTGMNSLSAYLTYGRDRAGRSRWSPGLDHSFTTAGCGIHRLGKRPESAVVEIAKVVERMFSERCSGVALGTRPPDSVK
jgi:ethanolamine ammonia-lyase large subunit